MTIDQFIESPNFPLSDRQLFERVFSVHSAEFNALPDGRIWFVKSPVPIQAAFDTIEEAAIFGFTVLSEGATPEDLRRLLCLARCGTGAITRMSLAKVLSANPDLFVQIQRGKYALAGADGAQTPVSVASGSIAMPTAATGWSPLDLDDVEEEDRFNPESFFGGGFSFSSE
jgi:hypothetical protein